MRGFERIRDVIDLRDQLRSVDEVRAVTRDGIEVRAREAQMVFRVFSGGKPRSLADPYPFSEEAIRRLAYSQAVTEQGPRNWTENLKELISREIMAFVSALTIEEFMALQPGRELAAGDAGEHPRSPPDRTLHIPRRELTERFHTPETRRRLQEEGLELSWVGVGTWEVGGHGGGDESQALGDTLIGTWLELQRARRSTAAGPLHGAQLDRQREAARALLSDLVELWRGAETATASRCLAVIGMTYERLREMLADELIGEVEAPPSDLRAALLHLAALIPAAAEGGHA
jgi:hypothetical protein